MKQTGWVPFNHLGSYDPLDIEGVRSGNLARKDIGLTPTRKRFFPTTDDIDSNSDNDNTDNSEDTDDTDDDGTHTATIENTLNQGFTTQEPSDAGALELEGIVPSDLKGEICALYRREQVSCHVHLSYHITKHT